MLLYNITYAVPHSLKNEWLDWMNTVHIPEILATGCFQRYLLLQLLEVDETEFRTYALQLFAEKETEYRRYQEQFAPQLRQQANTQWGENVLGFRTLMSVLD